MAKRLQQLHHSPLVTNASINRQQATRAFQGGLTVAEIAAEWPKVFRMNADGKLSQIYDSEIADGSGRLETKYKITSQSVIAAIARKAGIK